MGASIPSCDSCLITEGSTCSDSSTTGSMPMDYAAGAEGTVTAVDADADADAPIVRCCFFSGCSLSSTFSSPITPCSLFLFPPVEMVPPTLRTEASVSCPPSAGCQSESISSLFYKPELGPT